MLVDEQTKEYQLGWWRGKKGREMKKKGFLPHPFRFLPVVIELAVIGPIGWTDSTSLLGIVRWTDGCRHVKTFPNKFGSHPTRPYLFYFSMLESIDINIFFLKRSKREDEAQRWRQLVFKGEKNKRAGSAQFCAESRTDR